MADDVAVITDPDRIRNYLRDESWSFEGRAEAVYLPRTEEEVARVLAEANRTRRLVTVSAGGTSITGARVPLCGGAVISLERLTRLDKKRGRGPFFVKWERFERGGFTVLVDLEHRRAVVPPALPLSELDAILAPRGLLYPPDPTEMAANIGGTVATNASGARSFHHGPTRAWVRRLRVVLTNGDRVELKRGQVAADGRDLVIPTSGEPRHVTLPDPAEYTMPACKNAAGLFLRPGMDAIDLFIGGEGILGVICEIEVALIPRPAETLTTVAYFRAVEDLLDFAEFGVQERGWFLSMESFDARSLDLMRPKHPDLPGGAAGAVLFEVPYAPSGEAGPYPPSETVERLRDTLDRFHAMADWAAPTEQREALRLFRHGLPETVNDFGRAHQGKLGADLAVPHERFREMYATHERLAAASGVPFAMWGHIGDDHLHLNFLARDGAELDRARKAYVELARRAVALGGTLSAEHGVGKKSFEVAPGRVVPYLALMFGQPALRAIAAVKRVLDPNWILNVGNVIPKEAAAWT